MGQNKEIHNQNGFQNFLYYYYYYLGRTQRNKTPYHEGIKSRLKSGNACYHSVQNILSSNLIPTNMEIKIYRTVILSVVLYGCETWSLTLREESRLRVFGNRVLRRIFGGRGNRGVEKTT
jgi:hypothetical protein